MERTSRQRSLILEIVRNSRNHPTAEAVYAEARKLMPNISLGTVYRNLRQLTTAGSIRAVSFGSEPDRFDGMLDAHEQFVCLTCGTVYDIQPTLGHPHLPGKTVTNYRLDYFGSCEACTNK